MSIIIAFVVFISLDYPMESLMFPDIFYPITLGFTKRSRPLFYFPLFFARGTCIFNFERRGGLNMHIRTQSVSSDDSSNPTIERR